MQKALSIAAPLATLILFLGVAVSSRATVVILGAYGLLFLMVGAPCLAIAMKSQERALKYRRQQPRVMGAAMRALRGLLFTYPVLILAIIVLSIVNPSHESGAVSVHEFTSFGLVQIMGLFGLLATAVVATGVALWHRRSTYRKCPHCISLIPRQASRCKYCTAPVEPDKRPMEVTQGPGVVGTGTGTGSNFKHSPLNYARSGHKKDFGRLSAPRVKDLDAGIRTRPLPSEVDAKRRRTP